MDASILDLIPIAIREVMPVRNSSGEIIDYEWIAANKIMEASWMPDGGTIVGKYMFEFDPEYRHTKLVEALERAFETGETQYLVTDEGRIIHHFGTTIEVTIIPKGAGCIICSNEVTRYTEARDDARRGLELFKSTCDYAADAILMIDEKRRIIYANTAALKMSGFDYDELTAMQTTDILAEPDTPDYMALRERLMSGETNHDFRDQIIQHKDGTRKTVSVATSVVRETDTGATILIVHARDVTKERAIQIALEEALGKAEIATRMKSEFLANMSHEIRTPLNGVIGMSQVLAKTELTEAQADYLGIIQSSGSSLMILLNDILDLSKIEAGKLDVSPINADLRHKLSRVYKTHLPAAEQKGIDLNLVVDPSVPARLNFDPVRVRQCIDNLVSNALKFTATGQIMIAITSQPEREGQHLVTIHVSDTGCGISRQTQATIFNAFQQGDGSITRNHGGTGLGLTITRKLARLMGGDITLVSDEGRGSVFTLTFCAGESHAALPDMTSVSDNKSAHTLFDSGFAGKRVLIVDDSAINRQVAALVLQDYGFLIDEAENGKIALDKLRTATFDLVILDIHMPVLDGVETTRKIRAAKEDWWRIPILALTADAMSGDREKYISMGITGYASKPINERDLIAEIGVCLMDSTSADLATG